MKKYRALILLSCFLAGAAFMTGFFVEYHLPRIEAWALQEIESQTAKKSPLRIWPQKIQLSFFPPGLVLSRIRVLPQNELQRVMAPTTIKEASLRINWFYLITGRLRLSYIGLNGAQLKIILKERPKTRHENLAEFDIRTLTNLPFDEIQLSDLAFWLKIESTNLAMHVENLNTTIENRASSLWIDFAAPSSLIKWKKETEPLPISVETKLLLSNEGIKITAIKAKAAQSFLVASGHIGDSWDLKARTSIDLPDINKWAQILFPKLHFPILEGSLKNDVAITGAKATPQAEIQLEGSDVSVDKFVIGNLKAKWTIDPKKWHIDELEIQNSSGRAKVSAASLFIDKMTLTKAKVTTDRLEIGELLKLIKIPNVPIRLFSTANLNCEGTWSESPRLTCQGDIKVNDLLVHTGGRKPKTIVAANEAKAIGQVEVTQQRVTYKADLKLGQYSHGTSTGSIDYKNGFKINYASQNLDTRDIKNLVDLKLDGVLKLEGSTEGNSKVGRLALKASGKDVWLDDYRLGDVESEVEYKAGILSFKKLVGSINSSRYLGTISVHLPREEILIQARSPYLDLGDLKEVFPRKINLPFTVSGSGMADLKAWGPLRFRELSYELHSAFYRGSLSNESFDQLIVNLVADKGEAQIQQGLMARGQSTIEASGKLSALQKVDAVLVGRRLRLEESENLANLGLDATGQLDFTMSIRGPIDGPTFDSYGRFAKMIIADRPVDDSTFKFKFNNDRLEGGGSFIGDVVNVDFIYPLKSDQPFLFKGKTKKWNFANLFSTFSNATRQRDIQTSLTTEFQLISERGGLDRANGQVQISEVKIQRGSVGIANASPIRWDIKDGALSSKQFSVEGDGGFLKLNIAEISKQKLAATVTGKLDLSLMTLFTPFLADLQGRASMNISLSGTGQSPTLAGSAYIEQGIVKFRELPQPFTNIRADILFSEQGLALNALRADLGGGVVTGEGRVKWTGKKQIPVDIKGQFSAATVVIPEGFKTKGSGNWSFSGNYFPYTLALNYDVEGGEITSEFQGANLERKSISPSSLLPKFLSQSSDQPILLDLNIKLNNGLPIRNSLMEGPIKGRLHIVGPPNSPKLTGVVNPLPGGKLFFRDVPFEIQTGFVEYQDDPPDNAKVYLTALTTVKEVVRDENNPTREKENEYEVSLLVQGRLKPRPKFTLTSLPALNEKEIVSLLALGLTSTALEQNRTGGQIAASNSVQYGAQILQKPISKEVRSRLGLDVQLTQANSTAESSSTTTKITITKQFTPKLSASASRTIEKNATNSAKLEYKVNRNLYLIGSWDGGTTQIEENKNVNPSIFGLDLEFKVNFK